MMAFSQDLRLGGRLLRKNPGFTVVAVLSLALGIGANTTIFTFVNSIFLQPLPVENPDRLVTVYTLDKKNPGYFGCSYPNYLDYRDQNAVFSGLIIYISIQLSLDRDAGPQDILGQLVSGNYFSVLGVKPVLGRAFLPEEDQVPGARPVVVVSHSFWVKHLGSDQHALGRTIILNSHPFTVVGVAPPGFVGTNALLTSEIWVPAMMYREVFPIVAWFNERRALLFTALGRLKPGVARAQAQAALAALTSQLERTYPRDNEGRSLTLVPLAEATINPNARGNFVRIGAVLMSVVGLVLLIACANIANLLLARATARRKEIAIRLALGAARLRLIRQLLTESVIVSMLGGAVGLLFARWARTVMWSARPPALLGTDLEPPLDLRVLLFTLLLSVAAGVFFGLVPALQTTSADLVTDLKERAGQYLGGGRIRLRSLLVAFQVAISVLSLAGAGLSIRSIRNAESIKPGFETSRMLVISYNLASAGYTEARGREFQKEIVRRVQTVPGIESAALATGAPLGGGRNFARTVVIEGQQQPADDSGAFAIVNAVDPGYLLTTGIPVLRGRNFSEIDDGNRPPVVIVNETMARRYWPGELSLVIGKRFRFFGSDSPVEIVGVARDANYRNLGEKPQSFVYVPLRQNYSPVNTLHVRTKSDPAFAIGSVRRTVQELDPHLLLSDVRTVPEIIDRALWAPRMGASLLTLFGGLALLLASVGIYGLVAYSVNTRAREIGIRMALGATSRQVLREVLAEGMKPVLTGSVCGLAAASVGARMTASLLYGVGAFDVLSFLAAPGLLLLVALGACLVPARKATRVDPAIALHYE